MPDRVNDYHGNLHHRLTSNVQQDVNGLISYLVLERIDRCRRRDVQLRDGGSLKRFELVSDNCICRKDFIALFASIMSTRKR